MLSRRLAPIALALLLTAGPAACGDDAAPGAADAARDDVADTADSAPADAADGRDTDDVGAIALPSAPGSDVVLTIDGTALALTVAGDARIATDDLLPVALGTVDAVDDGVNYDPWWLDAASPFPVDPPAGLTFRAPTAATRVAGADPPAFDLAFDGGFAARLTFAPAGEGRFAVDLVPTAGAERVAWLRLGVPVPAGERLYGGGNQHDRPTLDGKRLAMQLELDLDLETAYNERHVPVPLALSTGGWGVFAATDYPAVLEVGAPDVASRAATFTVGAGSASADGLRVYLLAAPHPLDLLLPYYELTGFPRVPGRADFGPWIWRDETPGQGAADAPGDNAGVLADLAHIRALHLPTSGYWIDRPYASGVNTFDFDPARYADPDAMLATALAAGFRVALWQTPYAATDAGDVRAEVEAEGYLPVTSGLSLNTFGATPVDLTNPDARAYWGGLIRRYTDQGVTGFKLDFAEDVVPGLPGDRSTPWRFADGSDERTMHRGYQLLYHQVYSEQIPAGGSFVLARTGRWGDQGNVDCLWPGDLDADFARHRDGGRVGGIPAALVYGLSVSASGYPFYAPDTGGYRNGPPSAEAFSRWFEMTSVAAVMQVGGDDNQVPWEASRWGDDAARVLSDYRRYAELHQRLVGYAWTLAKALFADGRPLTRPLGLAYPELAAGDVGDVYLFGDSLLVAPVVEAGATSREVTFPPGRWVGWWDGDVHVGPTTEAVAAPVGTLPLYLRAGDVVPLLRPGMDTLAPATDAGVESFANRPGRLWPRAVAGAAGAVTIWDGASVSVADDGGVIVLGATTGAELAPGAVVELIAFGASPPAAVTVDGGAVSALAGEEDLEDAAAGWYFDPSTAGGRLFVVVPAGADVRVRRP
ncbi:MAG: glycoside hydrolase family 31 protein [Deltaproteobacteria bacterium]|nr:glycoside hydrolase family 31 protein [Deltaproteobacteria bacterium]